MKLPMVLAAFALLALPRPSLAEPGYQVVGCHLLAETRPLPGTTVPANLPGFWIRPNIYHQGQGGLSLEGMRFELREAGASEPVPIVIEKLANDSHLVIGLSIHAGEEYLVKPQRDLRTGEVTLSYLDDCGPYAGRPLVTPPVRNERFRFRVGPAVVPPARIGVAKVREVMIAENSGCGIQRIYVEITLDPALNAFPLLAMTQRVAGQRYLVGSFSRYTSGTVVAAIFASCQPPVKEGYLPPGRSEVVIEASVAGGAKIAEPLVVTLDVDCAGDASACPDRIERDGGGMRDGDAAVEAGSAREDGQPAPPPGDGAPAVTTDGPSAPATSAPDAETALRAPGGGCECTAGGRAGPAALGWLLVAAAGLCARFRRRR